MSSIEPEFLSRESAETEDQRLAYINAPVSGSEAPGLVWLSGFNSVMTGTKASELSEWAAANSRSMLRFDYSGHGQSDGRPADGTIGQWLDDAIQILKNLPRGPQILVGSSMGGWIALLLLRGIARRDPKMANLPQIAGAVLIAPAWDMTEKLMWENFPDEIRADILREGYHDLPSQYDTAPYRITDKLISEGRNHLIGKSRFKPPCPVRILQGVKDADVPWRHVSKLTDMLVGEDVMLLFIPDGDHRLSRPKDIQKLFDAIDEIYDICARHNI